MWSRWREDHKHFTFYKFNKLQILLTCKFRREYCFSPPIRYKNYPCRSCFLPDSYEMRNFGGRPQMHYLHKLRIKFQGEIKGCVMAHIYLPDQDLIRTLRRGHQKHHLYQTTNLLVLYLQRNIFDFHQSETITAHGLHVPLPNQNEMRTV